MVARSRAAQPQTRRRGGIRNAREDRVFYALDYVLLTLAFVIVIYPLIYIISSSFSDARDVLTGRVWLLPVNPNLDGYKAVFEYGEVWLGYGNSIFYTVFGTIYNVAMTMIVAYPLSRKDFVGRSPIMFLFTFTMFFHGGLIPTYLLIRSLGMIDTRAVLIIPWAIAVWNVIITRTYLQSTIPGDSKFSAFLEDLTNVRVNFVDVIESGAAGEKLNLMLASGDVPDVIMTPFHVNAQTTFQHGVNGTFQRLNELIDSHMPALKRELEKWPQYRAQLTMPDGGIYNLPELEAGCFHCRFQIKFWMYQPWFDKLGLDFPPTTTDELYEVLKAFKEGDPNGNGIADEIPMLGATTGWNALPLNFLMNAFTYTRRGTYGGYLERTPNSMRFVADTPEWREGLRYVNRLYEEGLIGRETFTQKNDQAKATIENPDIELVGSFPAGWFGVMTVNGGGTGRFADFKPIAPLKGPAGAQYTTYFPPQIRYHTFITAREEHPEIVAQWANWFYEDPLVNSALAMDFLEEGVHWRYLTAEEKTTGYVARDGSPAVTWPLETKTYGEVKRDDGWSRTALRWGPVGTSALNPEWANDPSKQEWILMVATRDMYQPLLRENYVPANLVFDEGVQDELADLTATIAGSTGLVEQWSTEFIVGSRDIDDQGQWDSYVRELERAGVERYVQIWEETLRNAGYLN